MQLTVVGFRSSRSLKCDEYQILHLKLHITVQLGFDFFEELLNSWSKNFGTPIEKQNNVSMDILVKVLQEVHQCWLFWGGNKLCKDTKQTLASLQLSSCLSWVLNW